MQGCTRNKAVWYSPGNLLEVRCACDFIVFRRGGGFAMEWSCAGPDGGGSRTAAQGIAELDCVASGLAQSEEGGRGQRRCADGSAVRRDQRAGRQAARLGPLSL